MVDSLPSSFEMYSALSFREFWTRRCPNPVLETSIVTTETSTTTFFQDKKILLPFSSSDDFACSTCSTQSAQAESTQKQLSAWQTSLSLPFSKRASKERFGYQFRLVLAITSIAQNYCALVEMSKI